MPYRPTERTRARLAAVRERIVDAALAQLAWVATRTRTLPV
jgi:hypothetical protein